ncbi:MAG TPA: hypothetical protein PLQ35_05655 [bacterium]|nr:hypothetical protein [bacterium]HQL61762.1 hypothetical protein [bacterium]
MMRIDTNCCGICFYLQPFFVLALAWGLSLPGWSALTGEGWDALLKNDLVQAEILFDKALHENPADLDALDGMALVQWTRGNMPRAADLWMELAVKGASRPWWSGYMAALALPELQGIPVKNRERLLKDLTSESGPLSGDRRVQAWREYLEWAEKWADPVQAKRAVERSGVVSDWWFVAGPFGAYGTMDLWEPFPPETDLSPLSFPGWISSVTRTEIPVPDPAGMLDLDSLIYPSRGTAYAFTAVLSEGEADALLTIESPSNYVVWWDGKPLAIRCLQRRDFQVETTVQVRLRAGLIPILVKSCRRGSEWWVRVSLRPIDANTLPNWSIAEKDESILKNLVFYPIDNRTPKRYRPPMIVIGSGEMAARPYENVLASLYGALADFRKGEFSPAQQRLSPALKANIAQAYSLLGDLKMREAAYRPPSRSRLQREAETAYRKAIELYPATLGAHIGLITYLLDRDNTDQALESLKKVEPILKEANIEYRAGIDYAYGLLYYRKNWMDESLGALQRASESLPPSAEIFRRIARIQADWGNRVEALETLKKGLTAYPHNGSLLEEAIAVLSGGPLDPSVSATFEQTLQIHPFSLGDHLRMVQALRSAGLREQAGTLCAKIRELYPYRPEPLTESARLEAEKPSTRLPNTAIDLYRKALEVAPQNEEARKTLRQFGYGEDERIERYDVRLEELDLSQADRWKNSRAPDILLIDVMVLVLDSQGTYRQYVHQAVKILNSEGRQRWAETVIPRGDGVEIRQARSILPDGTEWPVQHVAELGGKQALSMYGVEPGTIIEYAYLESVSGNLYPGYNHYAGGYFFGGIDEPMLVSKLTIILPENMNYVLQVKPEEFGTREILGDGRVALMWEKRLQDGVREESHMPPVSEVVPCLRFSTWVDWRFFLENWREQLLGRTEDGSELDEMIGLFDPSDPDLVRKVYDWVQKEIEPAAGSYTTLDTAILRTGSAQEKTLLAQTILTRLGKQSDPSLVITNKPEDGFAPQPGSTVSGQLLLRVETGGENPIWLDFNSRHIAMGEVDGKSRSQAAFVLSATGEYIEPVDWTVWPRGWIERTFDFTPQSDRSVLATGTYGYRGMHRRALLTLVVDKDAERRFRDSQVSGDLRGIVLDRTELRNADSPYGTPQLYFAGRIPSYLQPGENDMLRLPAVPSPLEISGLVGEVTRETPVDFNSPPVTEPIQLRVLLRPMIDAGYDVIVLPQDYLCISAYGYYSLTYRRKGDELYVRRSALVPVQRIEPKDYARFVEFCREIDEVERRDILFKKSSAK